MYNEGYNYSLQLTDTKKCRRKSLRLQIMSLAVVCVLLGAAGGALGSAFIFGIYGSPADTAPNETVSLSAIPDEPTAPVSDSGLEQSPKIDLVLTPNKTPLTLREIFAKGDPATVAISTETTGQNAFGQRVNLPAAGSGFIISSDGYIVTNHHVIANASTIKVRTSGGETYEAELIGADSYTDLAVLKIDAKGLDYLTFGDINDVYVGDMVAAIGNPLGELANTFTVGYVSALHREINIDGIPRTMLQTDAAVNSGNSGGPLLNEYGSVIGVVAAKSAGSGIEGLGFAIPSNTASDIIGQLIEYGYVKDRPYIGVELQSSVYGYNMRALYVQYVADGSPADKAGLKQGDYILEVNGENVSSRESFRGKLYRMKVGDNMTLKIQRDREVMTVDITLGEYKP